MNELSVVDKESSVPSAQAQALVATAQQEVQAQVIMARKFPRDQGAALKRIEGACAHPYLAEVAQYSYRKGGTEISGPSIRLLEAIKQSWGNLRAGIKVTHRGATESHATAFAWDLETNDYHEISFVVNHWRDTKQGGYAITDEREIYELVANYGSRRLRKCLETVIPRHIIHAAIEAIDKTLDGLGDLETRRAKMVETFKKFGVTVDQIEKRLGKKIVAASNPDLNALGKIANSLRDGMSTIADWFDTLDPERIKNETNAAAAGKPDPAAALKAAKDLFAKTSADAKKQGAEPLDILRGKIPNPKLTQADVDKASAQVLSAYAELIGQWVVENTP